MTELPQGWSVSWPGHEKSVANTPTKVQRLLTMLFEELALDQAQLGVMLNNGEFDIYYIDSMLWYVKDSQEHLIRHISTMYNIGGVKFDHESDARKFLTMLEQRYVWLKMGGTWA